MENFTQAIGDSFRDAIGPFMAAIPKILAFLVVIIIGWLVAALIARGVASLLRAVKFNDLADRAGFTDMVQKMGVRVDGSGFIGLIAKWFVRLIVLVVAFDALGLPAVSDVLDRLLMWLPNLVVALVVLVLGGLLSNALGAIVRGGTAKAGLGNPDVFASVARVAVWAFAIIIAVNQVGIATTLVNTLFMATVGAVALALGLAFGIGGRDTAADMLRRWYDKGREAAPRVRRAAKGIEEEAHQHR